MHIKRITIISVTILISCSIAFALTQTGSDYTLKDLRIVVSSGKAGSSHYSLNKVRVGDAFGGKAKSTHYTLDATHIAKMPQAETPAAPTVNPVTSPTNVPQQTLSGTKDQDSSIYINGYLVVPLDEETTWSYEVSLEEGENYFVLTSRNEQGLESESVLVTITLDTTPPTLSISVSSNSWDLKDVQPKETITMSNAQKIIVTNNGEIEETFILSLSNPVDWQAISQPGPESYVLNAAFSSGAENIQWNENHLATQEPQACSETRFAGDQNGMNVSPNESRNLFLQFKSPTSTQATRPQTITLIISCESP